MLYDIKLLMGVPILLLLTDLMVLVVSKLSFDTGEMFPLSLCFTVHLSSKYLNYEVVIVKISLYNVIQVSIHFATIFTSRMLAMWWLFALLVVVKV